MIFRPLPRLVGPISAPPPLAIAKVASMKHSSSSIAPLSRSSWRRRSKCRVAPRCDTNSESGDEPFCSSDNTAAACATAHLCSKSKEQLPEPGASEQASDLVDLQQYALPENAS